MEDQISTANAKTLANSDTAFRLVSETSSFLAEGILQQLPTGNLSTLSNRSRAFFTEQSDATSYLVGALPFDRSGNDFLYQPRQLASGAHVVQIGDTVQTPGAGRWLVQPEPSAESYAASVAACLDAIAASQSDATPLQKAVLSRSLRLEAEHPIHVGRIMARLCSDRTVTAFSTPLPSTEGTRRTLIGATPELLVSRKEDKVLSHPLAGSARRGQDPVSDRDAGQTLLKSEKDNREHRAVVEYILDNLTPFCADLGTPDGTTLRATASMWHLGTQIVGRLKDKATSAADLLAVLHPTPAVCGMPRDRADCVIHDLEGHDRGFYAGAVGWMNSQGDGEWYVAIRCAEINGRKARIFAGAGIVAGSDPMGETDETSAKFQAMLGAFGIDEKGRPLRVQAA